MLSIFRVITLEGWTAVMYNYLDAQGFIAGLYFPILVVLGSFFLLNLFLAVIMDTFSDMTKKQIEEEVRLKAMRIRALKRSKKQGEGKKKKDRMVQHMLEVKKKKAEITNSVFGNIGDTALILLAKNNEQPDAQKA